MGKLGCTTIRVNKKEVNNKYKVNGRKKSNMYKIYCKDFNGVYVGHSGRNIETRLMKH